MVSIIVQVIIVAVIAGFFVVYKKVTGKNTILPANKRVAKIVFVVIVLLLLFFNIWYLLSEREHGLVETSTLVTLYMIYSVIR